MSAAVRTESKRYELIKVAGRTQVAYNSKGKWVTDSVCRSVNEMLDAGYLDDATAMSVVQFHYPR